MPELNKTITESSDFAQFKNDNNLEVLNPEAINIVLFSLAEENKKLREMIDKM